MKDYTKQLQDYYEQKNSVEICIVNENANCEVFQNYDELEKSLPKDLKLYGEKTISIAIYKDNFGKEYYIIEP